MLESKLKIHERMAVSGLVRAGCGLAFATALAANEPSSTSANREWKEAVCGVYGIPDVASSSVFSLRVDGTYTLKRRTFSGCGNEVIDIQIQSGTWRRVNEVVEVEPGIKQSPTDPLVVRFMILDFGKDRCESISTVFAGVESERFVREKVFFGDD